MMIPLLWLVACSGGKDSNSPDETPATLTEIQTDIFSKSCAFSSCHGDGGNSGLLKLDPELSYAQLVNAAASEAGKIRVVPGDPDGSYLVERLEHPDTAEVMPPGQPLDAAKLERIRSWIVDGAQDN